MIDDTYQYHTVLGSIHVRSSPSRLSQLAATLATLPIPCYRLRPIQEQRCFPVKIIEILGGLKRFSLVFFSTVRVYRFFCECTDASSRSMFLVRLRDITYSNKSCCIVGQRTFALQNPTVREMRSSLKWQLDIEPSALREFETMVSSVQVPTRLITLSAPSS